MLKLVEVKDFNAQLWVEFIKEVDEVSYYDKFSECNSVKKPEGYYYYHDFCYCKSTELCLKGNRAMYRVLYNPYREYILVEECNFACLMVALSWFLENWGIRVDCTICEGVRIQGHDLFFEVVDLRDWEFLKKDILLKIGYTCKINREDFQKLAVSQRFVTFDDASELGESIEEIIFFKNGDGKQYVITKDYDAVATTLCVKFFKLVGLQNGK